MDMNNTDTWYTIGNADEIDSPALLVYAERIQYNLELLKSMVDDVSRLRPHVKTHKTQELTLLQMASGIRKFKCATIAEAEMLGECHAPDVLLAYPLLGPKINRFLALVNRFQSTKYAAIVDNPVAACALSEAAVATGLVMDTYIDLNIGMGRTGIEPGEEALALYRLCSRLGGLSIAGFHAYDGHVREINIKKRKAICARNFKPIASMVERLLADGYSTPKVIIGGSPSFPIYSQYPDVECSPGTFILWDKGYADTLPEQPFLPAAVLLCRVVSLPSENSICVDLGYKAIASENPLDRRVYFLNAPELKPISHSEEHMVLEVAEEHTWQVGDVLYALPIHVCPTVALYDRLTVVQARRAENTWKVVARKR